MCILFFYFFCLILNRERKKICLKKNWKEFKSQWAEENPRQLKLCTLFFSTTCYLLPEHHTRNTYFLLLALAFDSIGKQDIYKDTKKINMLRKSLSNILLSQFLKRAFLKCFWMTVYTLKSTFKLCYKAYCALHKQS